MGAWNTGLNTCRCRIILTYSGMEIMIVLDDQDCLRSTQKIGGDVQSQVDAHAPVDASIKVSRCYFLEKFGLNYARNSTC